MGEINDLRNMKWDQVRSVEAILLPLIAINAEFQITNTMLQLLQLRGLFGGQAYEDPHEYLWNFIGCFTIQVCVTQEAIRLRLFPFPIMGQAIKWLAELPHGGIASWEELQNESL